MFPPARVFFTPARRCAAALVLVSVLVWILAGSGANAQSAARQDGATFVLLTVRTDGVQSDLGTAFFINEDGSALTNSHVVYRAERAADRYRLLAIVGREFYSATIVCASKLPYDPATHPVLEGRSIGRDVAEVRLSPSRFAFASVVFGGREYTAHLTGLPRFPALAFGDDPVPGASVRIVGFGLIGYPPAPGVRWTATGTVDDIGALPDGTQAFRVVSTNRPREGNSGSPVLDAAGRVVGMWTWNDDEGLAYGVAIASSALKRPCGTARAPGRDAGRDDDLVARPGVPAAP